VPRRGFLRTSLDGVLGSSPQGLLGGIMLIGGKGRVPAREAGREGEPRVGAGDGGRVSPVARATQGRIGRKGLRNLHRVHGPSVHTKYVQGLLGYATMAVTLDIYSSRPARHASPDYQGHRGHAVLVGLSSNCRQRDPILVSDLFGVLRFTCKWEEKGSGPDETRTRDLRRAKSSPVVHRGSPRFTNAYN
jgi:hypothetical protein